MASSSPSVALESKSAHLDSFECCILWLKSRVLDRRNFCHRVLVVGWYKYAFEFVLLRHIVYCIHRTVPKRSIRHLQVLRKRKNTQLVRSHLRLSFDLYFAKSVYLLYLT